MKPTVKTEAYNFKNKKRSKKQIKRKLLLSLKEKYFSNAKGLRISKKSDEECLMKKKNIIKLFLMMQVIRKLLKIFLIEETCLILKLLSRILIFLMDFLR